MVRLTPYQLNELTKQIKPVSSAVDSMERCKLILSKTPPSNLKPTLVFTYDDGFSEDYDAYLLHKQYDVPGSSYISTEYYKNGYIETNHNWTHLTLEQMKEMRDWGWEFGSHGYRHVTMSLSTLSTGASVGDTKLYTTQSHRFNTADPMSVLVYRNEEKEKINLIGTGEDASGRYVLSEEPLTKNWASGTYLRLTDDELYKEIVWSKDFLESLGFPCRTLVYPYNANYQTSRKWVNKHYLGARSYGRNDGIFDEKYGKTDNFGINLPIPLNANALFSYNGDSVRTGDTNYTAMLNELVSKKGLGVVMLHSGNGMTMSGLEYMIQQAKSRNIEITTLDMAMHRFGNVTDIGDWFGNTQQPSEYFYVVPNGVPASAKV